MESNQDVFRFDLNESLYFETGQEVGEMTGISLDPEISIQPLDDYVSIKGMMELRGSYLKSAVPDPEGALVDTGNDQAKRYIENVLDIDNEQAEFSHRFPIDISVPTYRVHNIDDVTVNIGAFDYELVSPNQLKLNSTVEIRGLSAETSQASKNDEDGNDSEMIRDNQDSFAFDLKMDQEETEKPDSEDMMPPPALSQGTTQLEDEDPEQMTSSADEKERMKHKKSQTLTEFFGTGEKVDSDAQEPPYAEAFPEYNPEPETTVRDLDEATDEDERDESTPSQENISYLADMFGGDDEEETYSKMRLYIVQDLDTIESIADRYDISAMQLIRQNQFAEEGLEEGQILYIPQKKNP